MGNGLAASAKRRIGLLFGMHARPLLWRMMVRQGIDPGDTWWHGSEGLIERVIKRCQACTHATECRSWLARSPSRTAPPAFCRNRRTLGAFRLMASDSAAVRRKDDRAEPEPSVSCAAGRCTCSRSAGSTSR